MSGFQESMVHQAVDHAKQAEALLEWEPEGRSAPEMARKAEGVYRAHVHANLAIAYATLATTEQ